MLYSQMHIVTVLSLLPDASDDDDLGVGTDFLKKGTPKPDAEGKTVKFAEEVGLFPLLSELCLVFGL